MKINWERTWKDRRNDVIATCEDLPNIKARIYLESGGRQWYWFVNGFQAISRGIEDTKEEAVEAVKAEFRRLLENR